MKKIVVLTSILALLGCNAEQNESEEQVQELKKQNVIVVEEELDTTIDNVNPVKDKKVTAMAGEELTKLGGIDSLSNDFSIQLNNKKFKVKNKALHINDSVFNIEIKEFGSLTGSFTVVSNETPTWFGDQFKVVRIADETFKMEVKNSKEELYQLYKLLSDDARIKRVEIGIDYSRLNKTATY